jgi:hypothetical protein
MSCFPQFVQTVGQHLKTYCIKLITGKFPPSEFESVVKQNNRYIKKAHALNGHFFLQIFFFAMALPAHSGPCSFIQFRNHFSQTVGLLRRVISPSQGRYLNTGQHKHRINAYTHQTSFPWAEFEPTIPASKWTKAVHALDRAATSNIIRVLEWRMKRWADHVTRMGEIRNGYKMLIGNLNRRDNFGDIYALYINMNSPIKYYRAWACELDSFASGQDRCRALVSALTQIHVPKEGFWLCERLAVFHERLFSMELLVTHQFSVHFVSS